MKIPNPIIWTLPTLLHVFQSVLQQQASRNLKCECNFSSLHLNDGLSDQHISQPITELEKLESNEKSSTKPASTVPSKIAMPKQNLIKKQGVSGESCDVNVIGCSSDILIRKFEKDFK